MYACSLDRRESYALICESLEIIWCSISIVFFRAGKLGSPHSVKMKALFSDAYVAGTRSCTIDVVRDPTAELRKTGRSLRTSGFLDGSYELSLGLMNKAAGISQSESAQHQSSQTRDSFSSLLETFEVSMERSYGAPVNETSSTINAPRSLTVSTEVILPRKIYSEATTSSDVAFERSRESKESELGNEAKCKPQDPVPALNATNSYLVKAADTRRDADSRRRISRARPPSLSLSHGLNQSGGGMLMSTTGAIGPLVARTGRIQGPISVFMALVVAVLAVSTAAKRRLFGVPDHQRRVCSDCDGYGLEICNICGGRGNVTWEGKFKRTDPCPLCFGSCTKKCSTCGGLRIKKAISLNVLQLRQNFPRKKK